MAVDLLTSIAGIDFDDAWPGVERRRVGELEINIIGRAALLKNKRSTGRRKDELDADELERVAREEPG